jgi:hypothetical protein
VVAVVVLVALGLMVAPQVVLVAVLQITTHPMERPGKEPLAGMLVKAALLVGHFLTVEVVEVEQVPPALQL